MSQITRQTEMDEIPRISVEERKYVQYAANAEHWTSTNVKVITYRSLNELAMQDVHSYDSKRYLLRRHSF